MPFARRETADREGAVIMNSTAEPLSVSTRADREIRDEVGNNVIAVKFTRKSPGGFDVTLTSGVVTITGQVQRGAGATQLINPVRSAGKVSHARKRTIDQQDDDPPQGRTMVQAARTALEETGRHDLARLVLIDGNRPSVNWPGMGHLPSVDDVQVVHAALRGACEACAPGEIGEAQGQFTDDARRWYRAILRAW